MAFLGFEIRNPFFRTFWGAVIVIVIVFVVAVGWLSLLGKEITAKKDTIDLIGLWGSRIFSVAFLFMVSVWTGNKFFKPKK